MVQTIVSKSEKVLVAVGGKYQQRRKGVMILIRRSETGNRSRRSYKLRRTGTNNDVTGVFGVIGGGNDNKADLLSFVGGGNTNSASKHGALAGGANNQATGGFSFVGGGDTNIANAGYAAVGGGFKNQATAAHAFVGGGKDNKVIAAFGVIGGGEGNTVTVQGNAILGGVNNNDNGLNGVMIAGNGITAAIPDALHINGLWANNIPGPGGGSLPSGSVYWDVPGSAGRVLYIVP